MPSLILSRRDLDFLLFEWLDVEGLTARKRFVEHSRETFDAVLDLAETIATRDFAPHNRAADANEPHLVDGRVVLVDEVGPALAKFAESGLLAGTFDEDLGGMQLPVVVAKAALAYFQAANVATSAYPFLTMANANLLLAHGSAEQIDTFVRPMIDGRFFGTMCLSEPQAGSSLADITTRAVEQPDGTLPPVRQQDVDLRRRPRAEREHRPPGAGPDPRRARRGQGHLAVHRAEGAGLGRRDARRAQRRRAGRPQPQDGLPRHDQRPAELRRGRSPPGRQGRRGRLPGRRAAHRPGRDVPHDERGPGRRRAWAPPRSATPATCTASTTPAPGCRAAR